MWSDNETIEDLIGFRVHAELIADVVTDSKLLPVTMGVFGDWGSGKTSIMKMLQEQLGAHDDVAVLYFDAWLFEGYDDAKSALISSILKQLTEHKRFPVALKDDAAKLIGRVNWMRLLKMGWDNVALPAVLAYATGGATAVPGLIGSLRGIFTGAKDGNDNGKTGDHAPGSENLGGLLKGAPDSELTDVRDFRDGFRRLLEKTKFRALVVLIDDLDRCSPERIVENLEAIKLFLNVGNTAFVIGADPRIVRHAIAVRYRDSLEAAKLSAAPGESAVEAGEQLVRDYLEKLIQVPYHLPRLSPAEIETYMSFLFAQRDLEPADFRLCIGECETRRASNRFGNFGLSDVQAALKGKALPEELKAALTFTAGAAHLITENLKGNPRQVKRFLNAFVLRRKLANVAKMQGLRDDVLLKLMLLEYANETRFRELACWHEEQKTIPREILDMEAGKEPPKEWDKESLRRWVQMEPKLSEVDLSDYFWLVRDRLASSLLGLSLTPPAVKAAYAALLSETGRKQAAALVSGLRQDELDSLLVLLTKHVQRDPKDAEGYRALLKCAEIQPSGFSILATLIKQLPASDLPASLVPQLDLLATNNVALKAQTEDVITYLKSQTQGRAAKAAQLKRGKA
jgi:hypothetical protein